MGLMALDEGVFQHQSLQLTAGDDDVEVPHFLHHGGHLRQMLAVEIAADPVFELLRLADVDDLVMLVQHDVHARQQREMIRFFPQSFQHAVFYPFSSQLISSQCKSSNT